MADNLPLIPGKETICADVKPVLREVFREMDQLPPITEKTSATDDEKQWLEKYNAEHEMIWNQEGNLRKKFAKRISKKPLPNLYTLSQPKANQEAGQELMIRRMDLMPGIEQSVTGNKTLWVQNILNRSSCEFSYKEKPVFTTMIQPLRTIGLDEHSRQTYSVGELSVWQASPPPLEIRTTIPEYIYCVPEQINFVNFTLGQTYTQHLRLVNVSKFEIRLSVSLPKRSELKVELYGSRGLRVTAGSVSELKIHFCPSDVRAFQDELRIRTTLGKGIIVPIACYMEPPELCIVVIKMEPSPPTCPDNKPKLSKNKGDVVDLGAKLLGDEHCAPLVMLCDEAHASFFFLTEDAWQDCTVEELTAEGSLRTGPFTIYPAWWAGGGITRGIIRCLATTTGFHSADIRILSSTAVTRQLHVMADSVYYDSDHISIEAHEKDYDINSDDDPDCEYYVNLGTSFPNRPLSGTIQIVNHSPIPYSFYWKYRAWGVCSCWQEHLVSASSTEQQEEMSDQSLCHGAQLAKDTGELLAGLETGMHVHPEPAAGVVRERSACVVRVSVPDAGAQLGTHRAVLQLVMKDIPMESFKPRFIPDIVCKRTVKQVGPDGKVWTRRICDIVQAQMEVWWDVVPLRFVLDLPVLPLIHSRRVKTIQISFCATQLFGRDNVTAYWQSSSPMVLPACSQLSPSHSVGAEVVVMLPSLPNEYPETDVITLRTEDDEWFVHCRVTRACAGRHPALRPAQHWLGVVVPGAKVSAKLEVWNDTHQNICWWATPYRWTGENLPSKPCAQAVRTCAVCHERECTCSLIRPTRGALEHNEKCFVHYNVYAPKMDRIVATLVKVTRTAPDAAMVPGAPGTNARASLLLYRVLAPQLVLQVFPCGGDKKGDCEACDLDPGERLQGCALLRPSQALTPCGCSCYKLLITNITPLATTVQWEKPADGEEFLKVKFLPNDFDIGGYAKKEISRPRAQRNVISLVFGGAQLGSTSTLQKTAVILEPRRVCGRRLFVLRAQVAHAYKPLYLLIDTAIDGVRIVCEVPLGGGERNDSFIALRGIQKEVFPLDDKNEPNTPEEWFQVDNRKRALVQENRCKCHFELKYIPPKKPLRPPSSVPSTPEILTSPPSLTRVCACFGKTKAIVPEHEEPCCLQFRNLPIRTVKTRRLTIRNEGKMTARWQMVVRRWPRQRNQEAKAEALVSGKDRWAGDVRSPGVGIQCSPAKGICTAGQSMDILVQVYADCPGLYYDQVMLMVDHVEPIVVDVWIEAVGPVLHFATAQSCRQQEYASAMWLSTLDVHRTLRAKNISRSPLTVHAYTLLEHEHPQDAWPFRLYMRFTDELPPICPCSSYVSNETLISTSIETSKPSEEMDTDIQLYLAEDHGIQNEEYYKVEPQVCSVEPGDWMEWRISLKPMFRGETPPPGLILIRTILNEDKGDYWQRQEPAPALVGVRAAPRAPVLQLSCKEVHGSLCALDLHYNEIARVRKRFNMRNIGNAPLLVHCATKGPWQIVINKAHNDCGHCGCIHELGERYDEVKLTLEPRSSTEMCVEVSVDTAEMWPDVEEAYGVDKKCVLSSYPPKKEVTGQMTFDCDQGLLETLPLILEVDFPQLSLEPEDIDFGYVTHGDTRKTYFSVWHSSLSATITLGVTWHGSANLRLYPRHLRLTPGQRGRIYLQYTAVWTGAPVPVEGCVVVAAAAGAGAWCRGALYVSARPARDAKFRQEPHDHTDQSNLWPPSLPRL